MDRYRPPVSEEELKLLQEVMKEHELILSEMANAEDYKPKIETSRNVNKDRDFNF
jgi:hypothetical protein